MVKEELQKELKEKVKEGVKPSDLKKLKRSKSASDIPLPEPNTNYPYTQLVSQSEKITELEKETKTKSNTIKLLREKIEKLEKNPPQQLLTDQLQEKQKEIETLRQKGEDSAEQLKELNQKLTETTQELDNSLIARHESNKAFTKIYDKWQEVKLTLLQTEDEATEEIIEQDKEISKLRNQRNQMKLKIGELERDLELVYRAEKWKKNPPIFKKSAENDWERYLDYVKWFCYALALWGFFKVLRMEKKESLEK